MLVERRQLETLGAGLKAAGKQVDELVSESDGQAGELARLEARIGALHARAGVERASPARGVSRGRRNDLSGGRKGTGHQMAMLQSSGDR